MGNYISRDEFAKYLADIQYGEAPTGRTGENIDYQNGVYAGFDMAYVALKRFPAADVRPVAHGHYIGEYDGYADGNPVYDMWYCSECGCCFEDWDEKPTYNFCPNCCADMREEKVDG